MRDYVKVQVQVLFALVGVILVLITGRLLFLLLAFALAPILVLVVNVFSGSGASLFFGMDHRPGKQAPLEQEFSMAEVWRQKGAYDKAVASCEWILKRAPAHVEAHIKMARILREDLRDYSRALRSYHAVVQLLQDEKDHMLYIEAREAIEAIKAIKARGR